MTDIKSRVLIVDDEAALMQALCNTLQQQGYETTGCTSAEQAMAHLAAGRYDLMLTDLMMPRTDGLMLSRAALAVDPELVVVMMTGEGSITTAVDAMKSGVLDYVLKPFKLGTMLPVLERALTMRRLRTCNARLQMQLQNHAREMERANRELETANRELEAYAFTVSHDLRAPLRGIDGLTQLLSQRLSPEASQETTRLLELIGSRTRHAQRLIDDLLRLSRIGRQPIRHGLVDVSLVAREVADELRADASARTLHIEIDPVMPKVMADAALLRQVLVNLLGNAIKFTEHTPGAHIAMDCEVVDGEAVYSVRDDGPGFDMALAENLFTPFSRLKGAEGFEGSGVGLSIVQRIVQRHGGRVWAEARPGLGASFFFTLGPAATG